MRQKFEQQLVDLCAPTLAGLKPANLFRCPESPELFQSICEWNEKLKSFGLRIRVMKWCHKTKSCLIYVCRWDWICREIQRKDVRVFLQQCGYNLSGDMESVICQLARRLCLKADFPHEIGIFSAIRCVMWWDLSATKDRIIPAVGAGKAMEMPKRHSRPLIPIKNAPRATSICMKRVYRFSS